MVNGRKKYRRCTLITIFALLLCVMPVAFADEGGATSEGNDGGGFFSGISRGLSNLTSGLPNIFQELSPADVGHKPRIKPHFAFNQGFTSNARFGSNQADAAWQARVAPGIGVSIPSGKLYTEADYTYGFSTTQGRKTHANINTHNINALMRYDLSEDTVIGVGNNFQISEVPGAAVGDTFTLETATAQVKHKLSPKLSASLTDTFQWFNDGSKLVSEGVSRENDFSDNGVGVNLNYDATSDLTVGPSFLWNMRDFKRVNEKDYWQIQPGVAASYRLGPKTTLGGSFGWTFRDFENNAAWASDDHESELVYGASASHLLGRKLVWSVSYAKTLQDTFDTSFIFKDTPESTALDNLDRDFRLLKSHRIGSSATYNLNERNSVGAFGDVSFVTGDAEDNISRNSKNHEKTMEVGARYAYRLNRYFTFELLYAFGRRFSADNQSTASPNRTDYTFHKATGGVNITV